MTKEDILRKKIKQRGELIGEELDELEHELNPHPGEEIKPMVAKKRKQ